MRKFFCIFLLTGLVFLFSEEKESFKFARTNWLLYLYEETLDYRFTRILPFYSYTSYPHQLKDEFWFWPLLGGYQVTKTAFPTTFPYGSAVHWYTLPLLSLGKSDVSPLENVYTSTMISFLFMTYFQELQLEDRYLSHSWYSFPLGSYYQVEHFKEKESEITKINWGNPLFFLRDVQIHYQDQLYPMYEWSFTPIALLLGDQSLQIIHHARWGRDHLFTLLELGSFSLFSFYTTFSYYPGARYSHFLTSIDNKEKAFQKLFSPSSNFPRTRFGILSPFLLFESSPKGFFSWQLLPLFLYFSQGKERRFFILPLCLELGNKGVRFSCKAKLFPLIYHDEMYGSWDILWPLFHYVSNPSFSEHIFTIRFLLEYQERRNMHKKKVALNILEGLLISYQTSYNKRQLEILPGGLLFGYYSTPTHYQWRILGCGYTENPYKKYIQILFIHIPLESKEKPLEK